jgi:hypothetical protein
MELREILELELRLEPAQNGEQLQGFVNIELGISSLGE